MLLFKYQTCQLKHRRLYFILLCGCVSVLILQVLLMKVFGVSLLNTPVNKIFGYSEKKETRQNYVAKDSKEWFLYAKRNFNVLDTKLNESNATLNRLRQMLNSISEDI